jgi:hypothetical protein
MSKEAIQSNLPKLLVAPNTTQASARHETSYIGNLGQWRNFEQDVATSTSRRWPQTVIDYSLQTRDLREEEVYVADETGVQGRFVQAIGQVLGAILRAAKINIRFGDHKSAGTAYSKTPDIAMISPGDPMVLKAVGEIKVPWVFDHSLDQQFQSDTSFRRTIGQVVEYMVDEGVPYGFHSTYEETSFLRQVQVNGLWQVQCSPTIKWDNATVSVRQCFWHLSVLAADGQRAVNPNPKSLLFF